MKYRKKKERKWKSFYSGKGKKKIKTKQKKMGKRRKEKRKKEKWKKFSKENYEENHLCFEDLGFLVKNGTSHKWLVSPYNPQV